MPLISSLPCVITGTAANLLNFSIISNWNKLFAVSGRGSSKQLSYINGMRIITMSWIVIAHTTETFLEVEQVNNIVAVIPKARDNTHTYCFYISLRTFRIRPFHWCTVRNVSTSQKGSCLQITQDFLYQVFLNGYICVDSFFFLGGLLISFNWMKVMEKNGGRLNLIMFYFHRYIRQVKTAMAVFSACFLRKFTRQSVRTLHEYLVFHKKTLSCFGFCTWFTWAMTYHLAPNKNTAKSN